MLTISMAISRGLAMVFVVIGPGAGYVRVCVCVCVMVMVVSYLGAEHFAVGASTTVALLIPEAAVGELEPVVVAGLPDAHDYTHTRKLRINNCSDRVSPEVALSP